MERKVVAIDSVEKMREVFGESRCFQSKTSFELPHAGEIAVWFDTVYGDNPDLFSQLLYSSAKPQMRDLDDEWFS